MDIYFQELKEMHIIQEPAYTLGDFWSKYIKHVNQDIFNNHTPSE